MINLKYMNHELKLYYNNDYKCIKCGISILIEPNDCSYWFIDEDGEEDFNNECTITCEDFLIKKIIE
jgi:hypothetical protein